MVRRYILSVLVACWAGSFCFAPPATAVLITGYNANVHDRFDSTSFIGSSYDWSGVGKAGGRWATLIAPQYVVSANHFPPGGSVTFWEDNSSTGATVTRTISSGVRIAGTDLWLGTLNAPVTGNIS